MPTDERSQKYKQPYEKRNIDTDEQDKDIILRETVILLEIQPWTQARHDLTQVARCYHFPCLGPGDLGQYRQASQALTLGMVASGLTSCERSAGPKVSGRVGLWPSVTNFAINDTKKKGAFATPHLL